MLEFSNYSLKESKTRRLILQYICSQSTLSGAFLPKKTPALDQKGRNIWCRITTLFTPHSKNMAPDGGVFKKTGGI